MTAPTMIGRLARPVGGITPEADALKRDQRLRDAIDRLTGDLNMFGTTVLNVIGLGANGTGLVDDVSVINRALTTASGTGVPVYLPAGTYLVGSSILMPSGTTLFLSAGATIVRGFAGGGNTSATIRNSDLVSGNSNIRIVGDGTVKTITAAFTGKHIGFTKVSHFLLADFSITGIYGDWNTFLSDCTDGRLDGLYIDSGTVVFEDGIHIEGGARITIDSCFVQCGDDALALVQESTFADTDLTDIVVSNCYLATTGANMIRVHVFANEDTARTIKRISISNVAGTSVGNGIIIKDETASGLVAGIALSHVVFDGSNVAGPGVIEGVRDVTLTDVQLLGYANRLGIDGCTRVTMADCIVQNSGVNQCVLVASTAACTDVRFLGGHYSGAANVGLQLGSAGFAVTDASLIGVTVSGAAFDGIYVRQATGYLIAGCRAKSNGGWGVSIDAASSLGTVGGNDLRGNSSGPFTNAASATTFQVPGIIEGTSDVTTDIGTEVMRILNAYVFSGWARGSAGAQGQWAFLRSLGTVVSPSAVTTNTVFGDLNWDAYYDGTSHAHGAIIRGVARENWSGTNRGSRLEFYANPVGSTTLTSLLTMEPTVGAVFVDSVTATDIKVGTVGKGLYVKEGTNATMGASVLVAGTVTVSTTKVTANSRIMLSNNANGGTVGVPYISARTAATSFVITSTNAADTSTIAWLIVEPA